MWKPPPDSEETRMPQQPWSDPDRPPVRDLQGRPLPGQGEDSQALSLDQVDEGLAALPGWDRRGNLLVRPVPVAPDSREALREGVRTVVPDQRRLRLEDDADGITIWLQGDPTLSATDLETAARIDTVLSGSGTDRGSL
jgi:hypothetical protein